ncbi:transporter [Bythopirellula polymerisocia]|nr:transporter [Bythopirellula polymerisocia]
MAREKTQAKAKQEVWVNTAPTAPNYLPAVAKANTQHGFSGPFYWKNPQVSAGYSGQPIAEVHPRNEFGQSIDLMGPLVWKNSPHVLPRQERFLTEEVFGLADAGTLDLRQASNYSLLQGEAPSPPGFLSGEPEVVQIPSIVGEDGTLLPPPLPENLSDVPAPIVGGGLSEADTLGEEPVTNNLQFLRASAVLLEPGDMQFDIGFSYLLLDNDFTVVDSGNQLVETHFKQRQLVVPLEIRYGLTERAQFFINTPVGWAQTELATLGFDARENDGGIGDITTGISFLVRDGQGRCADTIFTVAGTFPTGTDPFTTALLSVNAPSLGGGFYAISTDLLWIETFDPVVIFYGLGWRHQFESEYFGVDVQPGEDFRGQLGVGFAVNQKVTLSTRFNFAYVTKTRLDHQFVDGTFQEPMALRFAATVANCNRIIEPFAEIGATDSAPASRFGITWTY